LSDSSSGTPTDAGSPIYLPGPIGLLMQQRDAAHAAGEAARTQAEQFAAIADTRCAEVETLNQAIASLGGEPPSLDA
jgi:hypothetical protein